jgi:hypothetical protein
VARPCHLGIEAVNCCGVDRTQVPALGRESHDEPGRHLRFLDRTPLVAWLDLCGAMARLID